MRVKDKKKEHKIKSITLDLVAAEGIAGVKMSRLAKLANISPSTIYTYFTDKEDLLVQVYKDCLKVLIHKMLSKRAKQASYKERLFQDFKHLVLLKFHNSREYHFFYSFLKSPYFKPEYYKLMENMGINVLDILREGQEKKMITNQVPLSIIQALIGGFSDKLVEFHELRKIQLDEESIQKAFVLFWNAISK